MKFLSSTSTKITLGIALITIVLLTYISFFAISTAQNEFQTAAGRIIEYDQGVVYVKPFQIPDRFEPIRREFNEKLINTIIFAGLLGMLMSITAGVVFSMLITKPLRQIHKGIDNLKKSNYKEKLEITGEGEFDEVIEEFNDLAKELEYQETLRRDLISDVSHELKTPITSLIGQVQGVKDKVIDFDEKRLETILRDIERLKELVNMLQEYTSLRAQTMDLNLEEVKVKEVADYIKDSFSAQLQEQKIELKVELPEDFILRCDKRLLERILQNLIDNAIKYAKANEITVGKSGHGFYISDNGVGIPEEHLAKIFERFYRVEKSRNRKSGGLGLGLALVKEMVEVHGWKISANNQSKGIRFEIITQSAK